MPRSAAEIHSGLLDARARWRDLLRPLAARPASLLSVIALWHERARQRRALAMLDDERLLDIGKTRAEALMEVAKPFWRD